MRDALDRLSVSLLFGEATEQEARWLRLEQVEPEDEAADLEQAADLIDALYGIDACAADDRAGDGGGAAADDEALPSREGFLGLALERLAPALCAESGWWTAELDVLRSHRESGYSLESERCRIGETLIMRHEVVEDVEMAGAAAHDLDWPYDGDLRVSGAAGDADVAGIAGSTVRFGGPVQGRVRLRYRALYDRVRIHVPTRPAANGAPQAEPAAVVCFWENLAAQCELRRPAADESVEARERERLCDPERKYKLVGECWEEHERYDTCLCSGRDAPDPVVEIVDAPCPEGTAPGAYLGKVREQGAAAICAGEGDGLDDPDYYEEQCCDPPKEGAILPPCEETREPYRGGAEIEHGPEYWKSLYGPDTRLVAVAPEDGLCGELVRRWRVEARDCGGGGEEPSDDCETVSLPKIPEETVVAAGMPFVVRVSGGKPPYRWRSNAPVDTDNGGGDTLYFPGVPAGGYRVSVEDDCERFSAGIIVTPGSSRPCDSPYENGFCWPPFHLSPGLVIGDQLFCPVLRPSLGGGYEFAATYNEPGGYLNIFKPPCFRTHKKVKFIGEESPRNILNTSWVLYGTDQRGLIHLISLGSCGTSGGRQHLVDKDTDVGKVMKTMRESVEHAAKEAFSEDDIKWHNEHIRGASSIYSEQVSLCGEAFGETDWYYDEKKFSVSYTSVTPYSGYFFGTMSFRNDTYIVASAAALGVRVTGPFALEYCARPGNSRLFDDICVYYEDEYKDEKEDDEDKEK